MKIIDLDQCDPELAVVEHTGTLAEFQADMEELRRRAAGEGEWNDEAWDAVEQPTLNKD